MKATSAGTCRANVPTRRQRHYSYNESLDEPAKLIADEPTDIEKGTPAEENDSVESIRDNDGVLKNENMLMGHYELQWSLSFARSSLLSPLV